MIDVRHRPTAKRTSKFTPLQIDAAVYAISRGQWVTTQLYKTAQRLRKKAFAAAHAKKSGNRKAFIESWSDPFTRRIFGEKLSEVMEAADQLPPPTLTEQLKAIRPDTDLTEDPRRRWVATLRPERSTISRISTDKKWYDHQHPITGEWTKASPLAFVDRQMRLAEQLTDTIDQTGQTFYVYLAEDRAEAKRLSARWQKQDKRAEESGDSEHIERRGHFYPFKHGAVAIVNNKGLGQEIPQDAKQILNLYRFLADTDSTTYTTTQNRKGKIQQVERLKHRATPFGDFGGDHKGVRGDGRVTADSGPAVQVWGYGDIENLKQGFIERGHHVKLNKAKSSFNISLGAKATYEILQSLTKVNKRGCHESALDDVLALEEVTALSDIGNIEEKQQTLSVFLISDKPQNEDEKVSIADAIWARIDQLAADYLPHKQLEMVTV